MMICHLDQKQFLMGVLEISHRIPFSVQRSSSGQLARRKRERRRNGGKRRGSGIIIFTGGIIKTRSEKRIPFIGHGPHSNAQFLTKIMSA